MEDLIVDYESGDLDPVDVKLAFENGIYKILEVTIAARFSPGAATLRRCCIGPGRSNLHSWWRHRLYLDVVVACSFLSCVAMCSFGELLSYPLGSSSLS